MDRSLGQWLMYKYGLRATQFISCCSWVLWGWFLNCVLNANSVSQRLFRIFYSSCWTTDLMISKQWFSDFFSSWDTLLQVHFWWITAPKNLLPLGFPFLYSFALLSPLLSARPPCKCPWPLFLTPVATSSPRSMWLSALDYSKWLGAPVSAACGGLARGLEGWRGGGWSMGWAVLKGGEIGWDVGGDDLPVDHHLGPGGLWWSTGSVWELLIPWKKQDI